jgi:3-oxoadipate enol-lactonase
VPDWGVPRANRVIVDGLARLPQFSHAAVAGDLVFVSGTLGSGSDGRLVAGGVGPETTQTLTNIGRILEESGSTWAEVAKVSVFLADMSDFPAMNEAYASFFDDTPPARITVGGVDLALGARVEIECVARRRVGSAGAPPPRRTGFVEHDGERLFYEVVGEGGTPLVLSHGAGGNHLVWYQQVSFFAATSTVVTWDHRGFGRSSDAAGRSGPDVAVGDLLAVLDHLGIERADLVGQSMGGWTTVGVALARPQLPRSIVLADTLGGVTSPAIAEILGHARGRTGSWASERLGVHPAIDEGFRVRFPERAHLYQALGAIGSAEVASVLPKLVATGHSAEEAARLTMPILCVVGDRDPLIPPGAVRALADLLPDARVVEITGAGHSPYFEDPDAWNAAVAHFLGTVERDSG